MANHTLTDDLKSGVLEVLDTLVKHNVKGASLILEGVKALEELEEHREELVQIVKTLEPIVIRLYEQIKEWLIDAYEHLAHLWDWVCDLWHKLVGDKQVA